MQKNRYRTHTQNNTKYYRTHISSQCVNVKPYSNSTLLMKPHSLSTLFGQQRHVRLSLERPPSEFAHSGTLSRLFDIHLYCIIPCTLLLHMHIPHPLGSTPVSSEAARSLFDYSEIRAGKRRYRKLNSQLHPRGFYSCLYICVCICVCMCVCLSDCFTGLELVFHVSLCNCLI